MRIFNNLCKFAWKFDKKAVQFHHKCTLARHGYNVLAKIDNLVGSFSDEKKRKFVLLCFGLCRFAIRLASDMTIKRKIV